MTDTTNHLISPRVVMVETSHPGNIGAAARAMKTMSLDKLALVAPKSYPDPVAFARSSGAADVLENAHLFASLTEAISDCQLVVGITARSRRLSAPVLTPKQLIEHMLTDFQSSQVAWIFGRERNGLNNDEIDLCNVVCTIPSNPDYGSLNIAAAIQVLCYEWYSALAEASVNQCATKTDLESLASAGEKQGFYEHLWQTLSAIEFMDKDNPLPLKRKLRRLFDRAELTSTDINILRGILKNVLKQ